MTIEVSGRKVFMAKGEILQFDGFLKICSGGGKERCYFAVVNTGDTLNTQTISSHERLAAQAHATLEASLVKGA